MMYRSVSSKRVIDKVFGAFGNIISQHSDRLIGESVSWIGMALEGIGSTAPLENITKNFEVKNGRVYLPDCLYLIKAVAYKDSWLLYGSQTFNYDLHCTDCVNEKVIKNDFSYIVNNGYISTSVPDGDNICIMYQAFPVDDDGFPLIPDHYAVNEALFWYITKNLMLGGFSHPDKSINYMLAEQQWLKYCTQAENETSMFDIPKMQSFINQWVQLIPKIDSYKTFFQDSNKQEVFINQDFRTIR